MYEQIRTDVSIRQHLSDRLDKIHTKYKNNTDFNGFKVLN